MFTQNFPDQSIVKQKQGEDCAGIEERQLHEMRLERIAGWSSA